MGALGTGTISENDETAPNGETVASGETAVNILLNANDIRALAAKAGVQPTKKLGQNFLLDQNTVRSIVKKSGVSATDTVLEIGPGLGSLTFGLLETGAQVAAVELDPVLAQLLPETAAERGVADRLHVVNEDALKITELPTVNGKIPTILAANLPYNVATPILITLFERFPTLQRALVMVQMEVADRLVAGPGSKIYGSPSVKTAWFGNRSKAGAISRQVFWPIPNVDSGLVLLERHPDSFFEQLGLTAEVDRTKFQAELFSVIDQAFAQRRKTLRANLGKWAGSPARAAELLAAAGIDPARRGETLEVTDYIRLVQQAQLENHARHGETSCANDAATASASVRCNLRSVTAKAPGKTNLVLEVAAPDERGYHPLVSVFQAVDLYETVTVTSRVDQSFPIRVSGLHAELVPTDESNLVVKAARALIAAAGKTWPGTGADIVIEKQVPVAGGMGGGSADAAATLVALNELWQLQFTQTELLELARPLGADVPFALLGQTALGTGYGDVVRPVDFTHEIYWVFGIYDGHLSTPEVYRKFDSYRQFSDLAALDLDFILQTYRKQLPSGLIYCHNSLDRAAFDLTAGRLFDPLDELTKNGCTWGQVSGSGPTLAVYAFSVDQAQRFAAILERFPQITATHVVRGNVLGAHLFS